VIKYLRNVILKYIDHSLSDLGNRMADIEDNQEILIHMLGEIETHCDKCHGDSGCIKCGGSGIVESSTLINWPW